MACESSSSTLLPHHAKCPVSTSRARYRAPRNEKAVKVYTISQESSYILIQNVPALGISDDLRNLCDQYGIVDKFEFLKDYPREKFTEVYLVKYKWFPAARVAKRQLDEKAFFGTVLHVCYAPEHESLSETREKLGERRRFIASKTNTGHVEKVGMDFKIGTNSNNKTKSEDYPKKIENDSHILNPEPVAQPITYIWAGKEYTSFPSLPPSNEGNQHSSATNSSSTPPISISEINIKKKLSKFNVPNSRISFKRKRRI